MRLDRHVWMALIAFAAALGPAGRPGLAQPPAETTSAGRAWFVAPTAYPLGDGRSWWTASANLPKILSQARDGDTVYLAPGDYLLSEPARITARLTVVGGYVGPKFPARDCSAEKDTTTLRPAQPGQPLLQIDCPRRVILSHLVLAGTTAQPALDVRASPEVLVRRCRLEENQGGRGAAVRLRENSHADFSYSRFRQNVADSAQDSPGPALWIDATSTGTFRSCVFAENRTAGNVGGAVRVESMGLTRFVDCDFYFNESGETGSALSVAGVCELLDCRVASNLSRQARPGQAVQIDSPKGQLLLSGSTYIVGNLADRARPQFAFGVDGQPDLVGPDVILPAKESAQPSLDLFRNRNDAHLAIRDTILPPLTAAEPAPGRWVKRTLAAQQGSQAYHCLYLPPEWIPQGHYPVIVSFPGNGPFRNLYGDRSGGLPEDTEIAFGLTAGRGFILMGLGYLDPRKELAPTGNWWGDVPATIDYCRRAVQEVIESYGGDPKRIVLCGFSRSAIGASFIGLHNDEIAGLWCGFLCYDGWEDQAYLTRNWFRYGTSSFGYDPEDFNHTGVAQRFARLRGRPVYILGGAGAAAELNRSHQFPIEWVPKPHRNHNAAWALRDTPERSLVRAWLSRVTGETIPSRGP